MKKKIVRKTKTSYSVGKKNSITLIPLLFLITVLVLAFAVLKSGLKLGLNSSAQDKCDIHLIAQITDKDTHNPLISDNKHITYTSNRNTIGKILPSNGWKTNYILNNVNRTGIKGLYYIGDYVSWKLNDWEPISGKGDFRKFADSFNYQLQGVNLRVCDFDANVNQEGTNCKDYGASSEDKTLSTARVKLECNKKYIAGWWYKKSVGPAIPWGPRYVDKIKFYAQITQNGKPLQADWKLYFRNDKQIEYVKNTSKTKLYSSVVPEGPEPIDTYFNHSEPALGPNVNFVNLGGTGGWPYFTIQMGTQEYELKGSNIRVCKYNDNNCINHKKGEEDLYGFKDYTCVVRGDEPESKCLTTDSVILDKETQVIVGWWFDKKDSELRRGLFSCNEVCTGSNQCASGLICIEVQGEMRCRRASNPSDPMCRQ